MILVLHTPRSGSTFFAESLQKQTGYDYQGWIADPRSVYDEESLKNHVTENFFSKKVIVKSTPTQICCATWHNGNQFDADQSRAYQLLLDICSLSEKVFILYRENLLDQVKSSAIGYHFQNYHGSIAPDNAEVELDINLEVLRKINSSMSFEYKALHDLSKKTDCELVCYEDWAKPSERYQNRNVKILNPAEDFKDITLDVKSLFER